MFVLAQICTRGGNKYFKSEVGIQKLMLENHVIGNMTFLTNCGMRFVVRKMLPNNLRAWVFRRFA